MVAIIGEKEQKGLDFLGAAEIMVVDPESEIPTITCLRPFSFSNIFVTNGFHSFPQKLLFKCKQTFSIKLPSIHDVISTLRMLEHFLLEKHNSTPLKNIIEKMKVRIRVVYDQFWITLNCVEDKEMTEQFLVEKLNLSQEKKEEVVLRMVEILTIQNFLELIKIKDNNPEEFEISIIEEYLDEKLNEVERTSFETNGKEEEAEKEKMEEIEIGNDLKENKEKQ